MTDRPRIGGRRLDRRSFLRTAGGAIAGVLAGCAGVAPPTSDAAREVQPREPADDAASATFRGGLKNQGYLPEATVPVDVAIDWRLSGINVGDHTAAKASAVLDPAGNYLIPGDTGDVTSLTPAGEVRWTASTGASGRGIHGTPSVANGLVYIGAYDGVLYAFDVETGDRVWKADLGDAIGSSPKYHDGTVYVAVEYFEPSGAVFGVDALTGEVTWRDGRPTDHPHSTIAIDRDADRLVVGSNDGHLYGWTYPGLERAWTFETGGPIKGPVATHDGGAVFGSWDGNVYRVSLSDGSETWTYETPADVMGGPAIDADAGVAYVGGHDSTLHALDFATGEQRWGYETGGWIIGSATVTSEHVLVGSYDGRLHAIRTDTGEREWAVSAGGGHVSSDPLVTDAAIVFTERATDEETGEAIKLVAE
jgi:outer membrane protein assembly factor BamB